jgi:hypothetical protein
VAGALAKWLQAALRLVGERLVAAMLRNKVCSRVVTTYVVVSWVVCVFVHSWLGVLVPAVSAVCSLRAACCLSRQGRRHGSV